MFGEHGLIDKRVAYETSSRVPLLMQCPELIEGGTVVDEVVANIDIAPTVMQAMGLKTPTHMDGQSFLPLARGQTILGVTTFCMPTIGNKIIPKLQHIFHFVVISISTQHIMVYGIPMNSLISRMILKNKTISFMIPHFRNETAHAKPALHNDGRTWWYGNSLKSTEGTAK